MNQDALKVGIPTQIGINACKVLKAYLRLFLRYEKV